MVASLYLILVISELSNSKSHSQHTYIAMHHLYTKLSIRIYVVFTNKLFLHSGIIKLIIINRDEFS